MAENLEITVSSEPRVRIIGVGGAGTHALARIATTELRAVPLTIVHTHARVLQQSAIDHRILLGVERTHGLGTGGDAELARVMAENETATLRQAVQDSDLVFLIAGMGGGTGTGVTPVVARLAKQSGALVVAMVTTPYHFEGSRRQKQALIGLQMLRSEADAVICVPNQKTSKLLDANTTVLDAFAFTNGMLADALLGIYQMLTRPGLINVDFAYLCSVLRGRHVESALATARASGDHRAREVVEKILASPLLDSGQALAEADQVLASIVASNNLTMAEINKIMEQLGRHVDQRQVIIGTAIDHSQPDFISVTIIASKNGKAPAASALDAPTDAPKELVSRTEGAAFLEEDSMPRPAPRFVAPPPESTRENTRHLLEAQPSSRKKKNAWKQELLALEIVSRGRFEKSEPTIHRGADLDVPTYIRRGVPLN
jgi:cell division protein FtsZ